MKEAINIKKIKKKRIFYKKNTGLGMVLQALIRKKIN